MKTLSIWRANNSGKIRLAYFGLVALLLSAMLTINFTVWAESDSSASSSGPQSFPRFSADLSLDRGCGAVYDLGDRVIATYAVSTDAQVQITLQKANEPEVILVNGLARGGQRYSFALPLVQAEGNRLLRLTALAGGQLVVRDCTFAARAQDAAARQDKETGFDITDGGACGNTNDYRTDKWHPLRSATGQDRLVAVWNIGDCTFKVTWTDTKGVVKGDIEVKKGEHTSFVGSNTLTDVSIHDCFSSTDKKECIWGAKIK